MKIPMPANLTVFLLFACFSATLCAAPADDIKTLLDKSRAKEAYDLGKSRPDQFGEPAFDFYFGVAAIDSGHAGEGVLALERYVINFPDNQNARLELARGYFVLGEDLRAREEFSAVLKTNPPRDVAAHIDRYLDALRARESSYRTTAGVFIEFGSGYDSNVNGGVGSADVNLPNFGLTTIVPSGVKVGSGFWQLTGGANVVHPVAPGLAVFGSVAADYKMLNANSQFEPSNLSAAGGVSYLRDKNLLRGTFSYNELSVDYSRFRDAAGASGEWTRQLDEFQSVTGALQYARLDYADTNSIRDSNLYGLGAAYRRAFIGKWQPLVVISGGYSQENNRKNRNDLGRDIYAIGAVLSFSPAPKWAASAGASYQESRYQAQDALFSTMRRDDYYAFNATLSYALTRTLSLRGEALLSKNDSNIALFEYKRNMVAFKVRYDFK